MKKLVSIFLTLALILSLSTVAFAAENTSLTITNSEGRTYNGYKLLELTTSLKPGDHPAPCDGTNHKDTCYNYAYTVNEKYKDILQEQAGADNDIIKYLEGLSSDTTAGYGTLRDAADEIYSKIKTAGKDADATIENGTKDIAQGYWLFADVTNLGNKEEANSLVMVDTVGKDAITINPKTDIPTVEKKVKDINDSNDDSITDNPWHDSADHDIGDAVPFKLTATLPSNLEYYSSYKISFHDTLSAGLTLDAESIQVFVGDTDVTDSFTTTTSNLTDGCTFEVSCDNVKGITDVTVNKDTVFVVYYEATLNEGAVIGSAGNPNEVYLEFSNNPYSDGTGKTAPDKVIVFTYQLTINKTDPDDQPLEGAGFTLSKKNAAGTYTVIGEELKGDTLTTFTWVGLDDGDYKLEETTVPDGYNKMADIVFSISAEHDEVSEDPALTSLDGGLMGTGTVNVGTIEKDIVNNTGTILPETGAEGTFMLITASALFVMVAVVFMVTRKKMSIYED